MDLQAQIDAPTSAIDERPAATPFEAETDIEILRSVPKAFAIDCEEHANWLVRKIVDARLYAERVKEWAEQEFRRAEREERTLMFLFGRQAEKWAREEVDKLHKKKSVSLPAGVMGFRTVNASLQVDDEDVVIGWARRNLPSAIITKLTLSRSILKDHFSKTGEMPDAGARIEPAAERFFIR